MNASLSRLLLTICSALPLAAVAAPASTPIPIATFFKKSAVTGASLSPSGRFVAVRELSPEGRRMLVVTELANSKSRAVANFRNADVDHFFWLSDQRLAYTLVNVDHDGGAGKPGLYAIDRDGKERVFLEEILIRKRTFSESDVLDRREHSELSYNGFPFKAEDLIVIEVWPDGERTLKRYSTRTGRRFPVKAPHGTYRWLVDAEGTPRIATAKRTGRVTVSYFDQGDWREIDSRDEKTEASFQPLLYADDTLYVSARNGSDEAGIYRYDLAHKAIVPKPLISAPGFDTNGYFILSDRKMLGYRFKTDADVTVWFDERMKAIQQDVDKLLPGMVNNLSRGSASETPYVLIDTYSDIQNHAYILYNTETRQQTLLGESTPEIPTDRMAHMSMVRYPARDGRQIPAFLTLPSGAVQTRMPTVVLVGSSPNSRNAEWQWNAEVQFLASRGYAVLQPEPRGIHGYGHAHFKAGLDQATAAVQDDIADAVKWAVAQGHTDPARVCIAGTGYGGYAAMMGLLKHAGTFKCGISWSGLLALEGKQDAVLKDIRQPLLLAYGTDDEAVKYPAALAFYKELKAGNPQAEWLEYTSTVEDWKTQKNRIDLWQNIERFLARQIGVE